MSSKNQEFLQSSPEHLKTWSRFVAFATVGIVTIAVILGLMAFFLT